MSNPYSQENLFHLILDSLGEGVIVADLEGKFLVFNPVAERIVGVGPVDKPQEDWPEIYGVYYPDRETPFPADQLPLVRAIRGDSTDQVEMFIRNKQVPNGVYLSVSGRPMRDRDGAIVGGIIILHDITDSVQTIERFKYGAGRVLYELATSDEPDFSRALQRITEADANNLKVERVSVRLFSADHRAILCEDLYTSSRHLHEKGGELSVSQFPRYFAALEQSRIIDAHDALADPRTNEFADDYLKPRRITSILDVPVRLHGRVAGVVCHEHVGNPRRWTREEQEFASSVSDLVSLALAAAERRRVEKELEESISLLRATLESTADGLLVVDLAGRIVSYNQNFVQMWRIPDAIIDSRDDEKALAFVLEQLRDPEAFLGKVRELYAQQDAESIDVLEFKDGRIFERFSRPQRIAGKSVGRVWSFRDVTAERRAYRELERINQLKTKLAAMISHELKTPLAAIQESLGIVLDELDGPVTVSQRRTLQIARNNAEWLGRLIFNFLTFAQIESGKMTVQMRSLDARRLVEDACRLMKPVADRRGIPLVKVLPRDPLEVNWDADKIKAVVLNLIDNAVKFTDPPGHVRVRLMAAEENGARIEVEDTGIGIREEDQQAIFDMFSQASERGPWRTGDFGVGLAICKYIVEHHAGNISVDSAMGHGSRFVVWLPKRPTGGIR